MKKLSAFFAVFVIVFAVGLCAHAADDLAFTTKALLPTATSNAHYEVKFEAQGGTPPYTFSLANPSSAYLYPNGLSLSSDGTYSGVPTEGGTTYSNIRIKVEDSAGASVEQKFRLPIHALLVDFKIKDNIYNYDGSPHKVTVSPYLEGSPAEGIDFTVTYGGSETKTDVGTYPININVTSAGYAFGSMDKTHLYINKNDTVNISYANTEFNYDKSQHAPTCTVTGTPTPQSYSLHYEGINVEYSSDTPPTEPGIYHVSCTITDNNFATPENNSTAFEIARNRVDFTLDDTSNFYVGQTWNRTYKPSREDVTHYTVQYEKDGQMHNKPEGVGTYTVHITLQDEDAEMYDVGTITPSTVTVRERTANFTVSDAVKQYSGEAQYPTITNDCELTPEQYTVKYYKSDDAEHLTSVEPTEVGTYTVVITLNDGIGYTMGTVSGNTFEITKKQVTFTVSDNSTTYDGSPHKATVANDSGLTDGDYTVTYRDKDEHTSNEVTNAGTYDIVIEVTNDNYTLSSSQQSYQYTVNPKQVKFTVSDNSTTYDGSQHTATVDNDSDLQSPDDYNVQYKSASETLSDSVTDAGTYDIVIEVTNDNYTPSATQQSYQYTVSPKPVTFAITNNTVPYDGSAHKATVTSNDGLSEGDDYTVQYRNAGGALTNDVTAAGEYDIVITLKSNNYTLADDFSAIMTITSVASLNVGNSPAAKIYNESVEAERESKVNAFKASRIYNDTHYPKFTVPDTEDADFDADVNTVIVNDIKNFNDPGMVVNGAAAVNGSDPVEVSDGLYKVTYTYDGGTLTRYVMVVGGKIGDANGDGILNALDGNYITAKASGAPNTVTQARIWDVNKDGTLNRDDADDIYNRFAKPLVPYYPWVK